MTVQTAAPNASDDLFDQAYEIYKDRHDSNMWWTNHMVELERKHGRVITFAEALRQLVDDPAAEIYIPDEEIAAIASLLRASGRTIHDLDARLRQAPDFGRIPTYA